MKYNMAMLRCRRLRKQIAGHSLTSLPTESMLSRPGRPDDTHLARGGIDFQHLGAKLSHKPAREVTRGLNVPSDRQHVCSKPITDQAKVKMSAVTGRTGIGNVIRTGDRSRRSITPQFDVNGKIEADRPVDKHGPRNIVRAGVTPHLEEAPKLLPTRGNTRDIELYATMPRKGRQQKTAQQHRPAVVHMPQRHSDSGISRHTLGNVSQGVGDQAAYPQATYAELSRHARRQDKAPLPPHDAMAHLKISWLVSNSSCIVAF